MCWDLQILVFAYIVISKAKMFFHKNLHSSAGISIQYRQVLCKNANPELYFYLELWVKVLISINNNYSLFTSLSYYAHSVDYYWCSSTVLY